MKVLISNNKLLFKSTFLFLILSWLIISGCDEKVMVPNNPVGLSNIAADQYEVSIGEFRKFIESTNYTTTADSLDWSGYFDTEMKNWVVAENANWEKPDGRTKLGDEYPVTQVSYYDACAYCEWKGGRLPTAEEWDNIAGDTVITGNIWEGLFPYEDEGKDGYAIKIAPRGKFVQNENGLYDIFGNVWEWTSTWHELKNERIIKGGSFLCDYNVCAGYIPSKFQTTADDSGLNHLGFRCVYISK